MSTRKLNVSKQGDREIVMTREFDAPRTIVFDALTKPELIKRWLLGPPGWSMPVCEVDLKVGGAYRYFWRKDSDGTTMGMGGVFREIEPPQRIVNTELFDEPWYPGEAIVTNALAERGRVTTLTLSILYQSPDAHDAVLKSGMEQGVAVSYDRLEEIGRA